MAGKRKSARSSRKAAVALRPRQAVQSRPAATSRPAASAIAVTPGQPRLPLGPPLEVAIGAFARELRAALDRSQAEIAALRAEVDELRQRYEGHRHTYEKMRVPGGGGHYWLELRFLQSFIDGEHPGFQKYGIWTREKSASDSDGPAEEQTTGPSA